MLVDVQVDALVRLVRVIRSLFRAQLGRDQIDANCHITAHAHAQRHDQVKPEFRRHFLSPKYIRSPMMNDMEAPDKSSNTSTAVSFTFASTAASVTSRMPPTATYRNAPRRFATHGAAFGDSASTSANAFTRSVCACINWMLSATLCGCAPLPWVKRANRPRRPSAMAGTMAGSINV